jgi:hypothetical protein
MHHGAIGNVLLLRWRLKVLSPGPFASARNLAAFCRQDVQVTTRTQTLIELEKTSSSQPLWFSAAEATYDYGDELVRRLHLSSFIDEEECWPASKERAAPLARSSSNSFSGMQRRRVFIAFQASSELQTALIIVQLSRAPALDASCTCQATS